MKKASLYIFLLIFFVSQPSCKSVEVSTPPLKELNFLYNKKLANFGTEEENYIFIRLYSPHYKNPLSAENTLKNLIYLVDMHSKKFSHAAIGFDLNDNFLGLTAVGKQDLKYEQCTQTKTNEFMRKCNPKKSYQTTYAIKVSSKEYEKAKHLTQYFYNDRISYDVVKNVPIGFYEIKRKFFSTNENKSLKQINQKMQKKYPGNDESVPRKFVCSSFVSYILMNSVDSIKNFFEENKIDYEYIIPGDIPAFPGMTKLFSSNWNNYTKAALAYVKSENNIFAQKKLPNQN